MKDLKDRRGYKNVLDALSRVLREEGFGKLYSGLAPGILRGMSMNVGQMACFDQVGDYYYDYNNYYYYCDDISDFCL